MQEDARRYYEELKNHIDRLAVTDDQDRALNFPQGIERAAILIRRQTAAGGKLFFIGNGASAAISSHMATDFCKNGGMRALAFNDGALLTCMGNDYGYELVFAKPMERFADPGDILIAISSSGQSKNILLGVDAARRQGCRVITLSGFQPDNPLRRLGDLNFYVPAQQYGPVEVLHHSICHCLLDTIVKAREGAKI